MLISKERSINWKYIFILIVITVVIGGITLLYAWQIDSKPPHVSLSLADTIASLSCAKSALICQFRYRAWQKQARRRITPQVEWYEATCDFKVNGMCYVDN